MILMVHLVVLTTPAATQLQRKLHQQRIKIKFADSLNLPSVDLLMSC